MRKRLIKMTNQMNNFSYQQLYLDKVLGKVYLETICIWIEYKHALIKKYPHLKDEVLQEFEDGIKLIFSTILSKEYNKTPEEVELILESEKSNIQLLLKVIEEHENKKK